MVKRLGILNIWVDPISMDEALRRAADHVESGDRPHAIFASNPEKNFSVPRDPLLYKIFKNADILIPDGIGIVLAARLLYGTRISRVPGVELMHKICEMSAARGYKIFVYGAKEEVNRASVERLKQLYPGLNIVGRANGYIQEDEMAELVERINASGAQILFLALGSPKQEKWYASHKDELTHLRVCQGIGGTLDTVIGNVKRAPRFWRAIGLEWFYRLISDPKRVKRQKVLPVFAAQILLEKLGALNSSNRGVK